MMRDKVDVTQEDRDMAAWALDRVPNSQSWEMLTAAHRTPDQIWQANRVAQAFAQHRQATEARIIAAVDVPYDILAFAHDWNRDDYGVKARMARFILSLATVISNHRSENKA